MRFLVLLTDLFDAVGGIQTFNRALVKALDEIAGNNGDKMSVLVLNDGGISELARAYTTPQRTEYRGFAGNRRRFVLAALRASREADVILFGHVHFTPMAFAMNNVPKLLVVHGVDVWRRLFAFQRWGVGRIQHVLSVSRFTRDKMIKYNDVSSDCFSILPNTLDPCYKNRKILKSREELGLPQGPMILSVSRLAAFEHYKRIDAVIEAMPAVLQKVPEACYVLVGDGADRARLEQIAKRARVAHRVFFIGRVSDDRLPLYYQACDLFVLPSLKEGFGIVFLEAMYYAKPCIGARSGGIPEVIEEGKTGLLVEPDNAESLTGAMVRLLTHDSLRQAMGKAGQQRLEREFSFEMFRQRLEKVLCL